MRREPYQGRLGGTSGVASLISGMSRAERRALHEAVKRRILKEAGGDFSKATPGATLVDASGNTLFRLTDQGWRATPQMSVDQVINLVRDDKKEATKKALADIPERGRYLLTSDLLANPGIIMQGDGITIQRRGSFFVDPTEIPADKMQKIMTDNSLTLKTENQRAAATPGDAAYAIGDAIVRIEGGGNVTITVKDDGTLTYPGFEDIFGKNADVLGRIRKAINKDVPDLKFKFSEFTMPEFFGKFHLFKPNIIFSKKDDGSYVATIGDQDVGAVKKKFEGMVQRGEAKKIAETAAAAAQTTPPSAPSDRPPAVGDAGDAVSTASNSASVTSLSSVSQKSISEAGFKGTSENSSGFNIVTISVPVANAKKAFESLLTTNASSKIQIDDESKDLEVSFKLADVLPEYKESFASFKLDEFKFKLDNGFYKFTSVSRVE